jgi:hypothetical protein
MIQFRILAYEQITEVPITVSTANLAKAMYTDAFTNP